MTWLATAQRLAQTAIRQLGNAVVIDGVTGYGILREPTEHVLDGVVFVADYMLELATPTWDIIQEGTEIEVDGVRYVAREQGRFSQDKSSVMVPLELFVPVLIPSGTPIGTETGDPLLTQDGLEILTL
jgi:hypothetical protein